MANVNYQKELENLIKKEQEQGHVPRLFLHACCAPCSSYVLEYLSQYFRITVFFYNPNIAPAEEYAKRVAEIRRLIQEMKFEHPVDLLEGEYCPQDFYDMAKGFLKEENGVLAAIGFGWSRQPAWPKKAGMITLQLRCRSVH